MYTYMYYFYLGKKKSCILNEKCLICFLTSRAVKGSMLQHHRPLQPAFPLWHPPIPTQLVGSLLPTHCLSCSVSAMIFPLSAFSSLFHSSRTWPGQLSALQASQSHGPRSPGCFPFLFTPPPPRFLQTFWALSFSVLALFFFLLKCMVSSASSSPHFVSLHTFHTS